MFVKARLTLICSKTKGKSAIIKNLSRILNEMIAKSNVIATDCLNQIFTNTNIDGGEMDEVALILMSSILPQQQMRSRQARLSVSRCSVHLC